ncbi:MAG: SGNH/GDSL hydrolase family protein [Candidatus Zixiibacteriota bacterium]|nr:MAG: SGNH/GDSL hydrolase family protein [candidate division Zixibacteria bacterium]
MSKKPLFAIVIFVAVLGILEITSRTLESHLSREASAGRQPKGWQAEFFRSFFDWHEPDPDLLWRFRANLNNPLIRTNSDHLLGGQVTQKKTSNTFRILLLGDSSPVGHGLKERRLAFGEQLRAMLEQEYLGLRNIELVNASVSGYTSEQIVRLLKIRGWSYRPDLVILYCGNNDASISGELTDRELFHGRRLIGVRKGLANLALYRILRSILLPRERKTAPETKQLTVRVSPEQYAENLDKIATQCREHNCPLIILKPPVPLLWPAGLQFRLFRHITGENGQLIFPEKMGAILGRPLKYCISEERFRSLYGRGDIFTREVFRSAYFDSLTPKQAIAYYTRMLDKGGNDPVLLNNLGVSFWEDRRYSMADLYLRTAREQYAKNHRGENGYAIIAAGSPFLYNIGINLLTADSGASAPRFDSTTAAIYLDSALQADFFSLRIKKTYREMIDRYAARKMILVIDLPGIFADNGGERLFIDHCHPTQAGHRLIASSIYREIKRNRLIR